MPTLISKACVINQIGRLKLAFRRWKSKALMRRAGGDSSPSSTPRHPSPPGCVAVYVGPDHRRFVVPVRFMNFPIFVALLDQAEEEFGFPAAGGIVLPCDPEFFRHVLESLMEAEESFAKFGLDEFRVWVRLVAFAESCGRSKSSGESSYPSPTKCCNDNGDDGGEDEGMKVV